MSRVSLLIGLFFISCILLFWNPFWSINSVKVQPQIFQPDFVADDMTLRQYNDQGYLSSQLHAQHMTYYDQANITEFTKPSYILYPTEGSPKWRISADIGLFDQSDHVVLRNNVIITAIDPKQKIKSITTSRLELNLATMMVTSDQAIKIIGEQYYITGVGLKADLNQQQIELIKDIQAVYDNNQS